MEILTEKVDEYLLHHGRELLLAGVGNRGAHQKTQEQHEEGRAKDHHADVLCVRWAGRALVTAHAAVAPGTGVAEAGVAFEAEVGGAVWEKRGFGHGVVGRVCVDGFAVLFLVETDLG